jgi:integrase/recombinase XerD
MFETCFSVKSAIKRHRTSPLAEERERFLSHLQHGGTGMANLRTTACYLLQVVRILKLNTLRPVTPDEVELAASRWTRRRKFYSGHRSGPCSRRYFGRIARNWLRFENMLAVPPKRQPFSKYLSDFIEAMRSEWGSSDATIRSRSSRIGVFLRWYARKHRALYGISLTDVDTYLNRKTTGWALATRASEAADLRAFFRHAESRRWCVTGISHGIKSPAIRRFLTDAQGPRWNDVLVLLKATEGSNPSAIRARAILMLFILYGIRSSEAIRLCLTDIDWENKIFTIRRAKHGGIQQYPLHGKVADAMHRYIDIVRPRCSCPNIFVTLRSPYRPLITSTMAAIVSGRMRSLGIQSAHKGPQSLRHACATRLLREGGSFPEIADFLGHKNCESVGVYAKLNTELLSQVSALDLVGEL